MKKQKKELTPSLLDLNDRDFSLRDISITKPEERRQKFEIIRERDEKKFELQKEETRICCSKSSKSGLEMLGKFAISMSVLLFAMIRLTTNQGGDHSYEASLISLIVGYYLRVSIEKKNNVKNNLIV